MRAMAAISGVLLAMALLLGQAVAQDAPDIDPRLIRAADEVALAYMVTGDAEIDKASEAGLRGVSAVLAARTSVEPGQPIGIDPEIDDLSLLTFLYWPVSDMQAPPSAQAYMRLNHFLRSGGVILFDTRDGDLAGLGAPDMSDTLRALAAPLDVPPLAPVPPDHVLTRAFYLLDDFPGRWQGRPLWAEAPPPDAAQTEGVPFRHLNDGVSPVLIGANDWAAAWAVDDRGLPLYNVGRGWEGERQRELAFRFGVNLIMYVLTGNYKSDQVHVPALLERLRSEEVIQ